MSEPRDDLAAAERARPDHPVLGPSDRPMEPPDDVTRYVPAPPDGGYPPEAQYPPDAAYPPDAPYPPGTTPAAGPPGGVPDVGVEGGGVHGGAPVTTVPRQVPRSRTGGLWVALTIAGVILLLLLVFILENSGTVDVAFFGQHGHLPLGVALLLAAVFGLLLAAIPGYGRIIQLRRAAAHPDRKTKPREGNHRR